MSALSEATATRRALIDGIRLTLAGYEEEHDQALWSVGSEDLDRIAASIADNLIDSEWVLTNPEDAEWEPTE